MQITRHIHHIPCPFDGSLVYVTAILPEKLDDPAGVTLIDTGTKDVPLTSLAPYLAQHGRSLADVRLVLNTHGDTDHAGGNAVVTAASGARVCIHAADRRLAEDQRYQYDYEVGRWLPLVGWDDSHASAAAWGLADFVRTADPSPVDRELAGGEEFDCGPVRLVTIHTPGHSRGSVCYYSLEERILITGDSVQGTSSSVGGFPVLYDVARYPDSMVALQGLEVEMLLLAHHFCGPDDVGAPVRHGQDATRFLTVSAELGRQILAACDHHRDKPPVECVTAVVTNLHAALRIPGGTLPFWAVPTILSYVRAGIRP